MRGILGIEIYKGLTLVDTFLLTSIVDPDPSIGIVLSWLMATWRIRALRIGGIRSSLRISKCSKAIAAVSSQGYVRNRMLSDWETEESLIVLFVEGLRQGEGR